MVPDSSSPLNAALGTMHRADNAKVMLMVALLLLTMLMVALLLLTMLMVALLMMLMVALLLLTMLMVALLLLGPCAAPVG
jgi:hypothetical protein